MTSTPNNNNVTAKQQEYSHLVQSALLKTLEQVGRPSETMAQWASAPTKEQRQRLGNLHIAAQLPWKESTLQLLDQIWKMEEQRRTLVHVRDLPQHATLVASVPKSKQTNKPLTVLLWQGDVTTLAGKSNNSNKNNNSGGGGGLAVVNAANDQGLGCFQPGHRCLDNVLHRGAGPRLRLACEKAMAQRRPPGLLLEAGTAPIVTEAFGLPAQWVIHVTGPQVPRGARVTPKHCQDLQSAYDKSLDAAVQAGATALAFPCISTGLFGFPADQAADIALQTVKDWLQKHASGDDNNCSLETIIFNVFTDHDHALYQQRFAKYFGNTTATSTTALSSPTASLPSTSLTTPRQKRLALARQWLAEADAVLVCAGAGMSAKDGESVYTSKRDFAKYYPYFVQWGYKTAYECMGLMADSNVPDNAKWAFYAKHWDNMRWKFTPNDGYRALLQDLIGSGREYFVLTSNADGCFERAGFDPKRIYTPQGDMAHVQCAFRPCRQDSVFDSRPILDKVLPHINQETGWIPDNVVPKCPRCGGGLFANLRGGGWYLHHKYDAQNQAFQDWVQSMVKSKKTVAIIEVGAGFNTPMVTRLPVESVARELGPRGRFLRVNPSDGAVPQDLPYAMNLAEGWQVLPEMAQLSKENETLALSSPLRQELEENVRQEMKRDGLLVPDYQTTRMTDYFGHFDWRKFMQSLRR